jgi:hypothetical protein
MSTPEPSAMTFDWPRRQRSSWLLAALIFGSLVLHSAVFLLVQVRLPKPVQPPRTELPVVVLAPFDALGNPSPENAALLAWAHAEDPARVARPPLTDPSALFVSNYRPSVAAMRTAPLAPPVEPPTIQFPPPRDPLSLIRGNATAPTAPADPPAPQPTRLAFSPTLANRAPATPPQLEISQKSSAALEPTRFLIGTAANGETRFIFLQQTCGQSRYDELAQEFLSRLTLAPGEAPLTWGTVTVQWGDDAYNAGP